MNIHVAALLCEQYRWGRKRAFRTLPFGRSQPLAVKMCTSNAHPRVDGTLSHVTTRIQHAVNACLSQLIVASLSDAATATPLGEFMLIEMRHSSSVDETTIVRIDTRRRVQTHCFHRGPPSVRRPAALSCYNRPFKQVIARRAARQGF
jgi:hypothetical protein